ncbi:MAG: quinoprotein [Rhodobacterales bacterium]|nr:MAG: quinoprotein [Rhodobacterales bacterium]
MIRGGWAIGLASVLALGACAEREEILSGKREGLRAILSDEARGPEPEEVVNRSVRISLPRVSSNASWRQRSGSPVTRTAHPAFGGAMQVAWSSSIGAGETRRNRINADPVIAGGVIYTMDSEAVVTATATNGARLWQVSVRPERDGAGDAAGGGLAVVDGVVYASSGFGVLTALDAKSGAQRWQQKLEATGSGAPTVYKGIVYLVAGDETAWAINAVDGRILWQLAATPDIHNVMGSPAPAVDDQIVVFGFGAGELQAAFRKGGLRRWETLITGQRKGLSRTRLNDITGDPVIVGDTVYAGTHAGRIVALNIGNGERRWTAEEGPQNPVWVAGGSVFLVSDANRLVRLDASDGSRIWSQELAFFTKDKPKKQKEIYSHYGPVVAGGRVIVASSDGFVRSYDPVSGALTGSVAIPGGATTNPVFANGVMYVVGRSGTLFAIR